MDPSPEQVVFDTVTHEHDIAARAHRVVSIRDGLIEKDERIK